MEIVVVVLCRHEDAHHVPYAMSAYQARVGWRLKAAPFRFVLRLAAAQCSRESRRRSC